MKVRALAVTMTAVLVMAIGAPIAAASNPAVAQSAPDRTTPGGSVGSQTVHYIVWAHDLEKKYPGHGVFGDTAYGYITMGGKRGDSLFIAGGLNKAKLRSVIVTVVYRHGKKPHPQVNLQVIKLFSGVWALPKGYEDYDIDAVTIETVT